VASAALAIASAADPNTKLGILRMIDASFAQEDD
jgi:hypothetical protein